MACGFEKQAEKAAEEHESGHCGQAVRFCLGIGVAESPE